MTASRDGLAGIYARATDEERSVLRSMIDGTSPWMPIRGPQQDAFFSAADVIGYGGAAGGGKTDLALGMALTRHWRTAIFRREATQLTGIVERLAELTGGRKGYNAQARVWRVRDGRRIEFGSAAHPGDETRHQGRAKDLLVLDEAQNFLESQARFLMGWVRSADAAQKCRVLLTFNPPTSAEGRWVMDYFAPWLDPGHPRRAEAGELRWFARVDGRESEVEDGRPFVAGPDGARIYEFDPATPAEDVVRPMSRTFIASRVADNPHLAGTGYMAMLQAMPEPLRSQMLKGDFAAGVEDDPWQVIPTAWVEAAMARWAPRALAPSGPSGRLPSWTGEVGAMDSMGVDVARGGRDATVIARRHGGWFDELICLEGRQTPDGPGLAGQVMAQRRDRAVAHIDVVGWGASPYDFLKENGVQAVAVNGAAKTAQKTREGTLGFANTRALLWWRMREALDPAADAAIALPPDPALKADLCAPRWRQALSGIQIEAKDDIIARIGRSPDRGDAVAMALMATPKAQAARPTRRLPAGSWMG